MEDFMEDFKLNVLDLQLFNDGATDDVVDDSTNTDDTITDTGDTTDTGSQDDNYEYGLDEDGNLIINDLSETTDDESNNETKVDPSTEDKLTEESKVDKFKVKVDGEELEVPLDELLAGYQRQSDYTRKTQALAEERKRIEQAAEMVKNPSGQAQETPQPTVKDFYENITETAKKQVAGEIGEDFDEYNALHMAALTLKINQITTNMQSEITRKNAVSDFEAQARTKEPENYDKIYEFAQDYVENVMPHSKHNALQQAFAKGDVPVISAFFEEMRKGYYNSIGKTVENGQKTNEPKVGS
jgi:hypothetical protein